MKRLDANVGSLQATLEKRPEVFEAIGVNLAIHILFGVVNYLMLKFLVQADVRHKRIGIDRASWFDVLFQ